MTKTSKTKILVIGGTGFVGSYVAKSLFPKKSCEVHVVGVHTGKEKNKIIGVRYHRVNLAGRISKSALLPITENLDTVVIMTPPDERVTKNVIGLLGLTESLQKVVHVSTLLVSPSLSQPSKETVKPKPISSYENNKIREENLLAGYCLKHKVKLCIIRLANVYGDFMNRGIIGLAFKALLKGGPLTVNGNGEQRRDYIFVEDAAKLIKFAVVNPQAKPVEIFNVSTGQGHTINEVLILIKKITGRDLSVNYGLPVPEKKSVMGNNAKILKWSGQKLSYDLRRGLIKTYQNYLKHESV